MRWAIVYGYGTPSAYVHMTVAGSTADAERAVASIRASWGPEGFRFTVHPFAKVVETTTEEEFVMFETAKQGGAVYTPIRPTLGPQLVPRRVPTGKAPRKRNARR